MDQRSALGRFLLAVIGLQDAYARSPDWLKGLLTGFMLVVAVALLLNRDRFGFNPLQGWTVNYGGF